MPPTTRRTFLKTASLAATAGLAARYTSPALAQPIGANGDLRVGVIGFRDKGKALTGQLLKLPDVRVVGLCDVDPQILAERTAEVKAARPGEVYATTDLRQLLARPDLDAVVIATPNHWHALATIWACQAGKDVYVEKPISHSIWEGRRMLEAAAKYNRIVQAGTQYRSDVGLPAAIAHLRGGALGRIQYIHALWYRDRAAIGRRLPWYPTHLDYDLFCGPAPAVPLERNELHYDWHWSWSTGNGDLANLGVHCVDIARRFAGHAAPPTRVLSAGGRYVFADAGETPNTQLTLLDYPEVPIFFETRNLSMKPGVRAMDSHRGIRTGVVVQCEGGYYAGYNGGATYDLRGKQIERFPGDGGAGHLPNFLAAVRSRRTTDLNAPLAEGHASTAACLLGNISYRTGRPADFATTRAAFARLPAAQETLDRLQVHLATHGVDLARQPLQLGHWIRTEGNEGIAAVEGATDESLLPRARFLLRETHRAPYAVPAQV